MAVLESQVMARHDDFWGIAVDVSDSIANNSSAGIAQYIDGRRPQEMLEEVGITTDHTAFDLCHAVVLLCSESMNTILNTCTSVFTETLRGVLPHKTWISIKRLAYEVRERFEKDRFNCITQLVLDIVKRLTHHQSDDSPIKSSMKLNLSTLKSFGASASASLSRSKQVSNPDGAFLRLLHTHRIVPRPCDRVVIVTRPSRPIKKEEEEEEGKPPNSSI
jgi:hypothetical protein